MYRKAISGQYFFFPMISVLSGFPITGFSGAISGRKLMDGSAMALLSGNIVEVSGGMYRANLYDWDTSGDNIGLFFTASGAIPVSVTIITIDSTSGRLFPASGVNTVVPIASISGVQPISGTTVTVPLASISGVQPSSGNPFFIRGPNTARSGTASTIQLDAGVPTGISGAYDNDLIVIIGGTGAGRARTIANMGSSGIAFIWPSWDASGVPDNTSVFAIVPGGHVGLMSGEMNSGQLAVLLSGVSYTASGINAVVPIASISGVQPISGATVTVPISSISGVIANSGLFVTVPIATISGVQPISGTTVTVPIASISGTTVATASGTTYLASGSVLVTSGQLSGQLVTANVVQWRAVTPNTLISSGRLDAAFNVRTSVARSGTATTIQLDAGVATEISGVYDGQIITIVGGTGAGRSRMIINTDASGNVTVAPAWDASGVPDNTSIFTITPGAMTTSGLVQIASGPNVTVPIASISGVRPISGTFVSVPIASISGVQPISGTFVSVPIASISGVQPISGTTVTVPIASISGTVPNIISGTTYLASGSVLVTSGQLSGQLVTANVVQWRAVTPNTLVSSGRLDAVFNVRTALARSGTSTTIQLDAGVPTEISGVYDGQIITIVGGTGVGRTRVIVNTDASGNATITPPWDASGTPDNTSIFTITPGALTTSGIVQIASGPNVVVPKATLSGVIANSGLFVNATANVPSGLFVTVPIDTISGVNAVVPIATISGVNAVVPKATLSGVVANSGLFVNATANVSSGIFVTVPIDTISGANVVVPIDTISGVNAVVPKATLSGVIANSGLFVSVPIATLSGVQPISGATVTVPIASISGVNAVVPISTLSGVQPISGATVTVPIASISGVNAVIPIATISGVNAVVPIDTISGVQPISGATVTVPKATLSGVVANSGLFVSVPIASISGTTVATASGTTFLASGSITSGVIASGIFVTATASVQSGAVYLASGHFLFGSGLYYLASGSLSGQVLDLNSGQSYTASGINVTVPAASISGVRPISGTFVSVPTASISGIFLASGNVGVDIPKAVLTWQWSGQTSVSGQRNLLNANRKLMNAWDTVSASGYLSVYTEDDSTIAYQQAIGTTSGAQPISSLNTRE